MSEKKKILECLINQKVSIVMRHGYRSDGIIQSIGNSMMLMSSIGTTDAGKEFEYVEYLDIDAITNIRIDGEIVKGVENYQIKSLTRLVNEIFK